MSKVNDILMIFRANKWHMEQALFANTMLVKLSRFQCFANRSVMITRGYSVYKILQEPWAASTWRWSATCTIQHCQLHQTSTDHESMIATYKCEAIDNPCKQRRISKEMIILRQFVELCILFLGSEVKSAKFKQPGAIHMARWMAKFLYRIRICLLEARIYLNYYQEPQPLDIKCLK